MRGFLSLAGKISVGVLIAAIIGVFLAYYYWQQAYTAPGPVAAEGADHTIFSVERGMPLGAIARSLERRGLISDSFVFTIGVRLSGGAGNMKAGEYAIPSQATMKEIARILRDGDAILHKLTVAEGLTVAQVLRMVEEHKALSGELTLKPAEGTLMPETYLFQRGMPRDELIEKMRQKKLSFLDEMWEKRSDNLPFDTPYEALILASIVEKETGVASERPLVASVFINRLRKGMRLQSDPTIIYGITGGEPLGRRIRRSELERETPYNTYKVSGLPPTPIANPGRDSIEAVLSPPDTDYIYFVADGSGGHAFASSLSEHNRNVAKWRTVQRERGLR
ncbi:MAG: endolytic transglycosylase MltG [Alphaproteobacteria bacterium]